MRNSSSTNKSDLAKLEGRKDWKLWSPKLRAFLIRKNLEFVMDQPFPTNGLLVPSEVPGVGPRLETPEELLNRQRQWLEGNKQLWAHLIEAVEGDAASVAAGARENDGLHAFKLLQERYESSSASSGLMVFFSLLTFVMATSIEKHVQLFKDKLRDLAPHTGWVLNPMQTCSIFLRSLAPKYRPWVQQTMTAADRQPAILYDTERIYQQTIEWERTRMFASGEADHSGQALWVDGTRKTGPQTDQNDTPSRSQKKDPGVKMVLIIDVLIRILYYY